jgi:hypothetical protein
MKSARRVGVALALLLLVACGLLTTSIRVIRENPRTFDGKTVTVSGQVKNPTSLVVVKYFSLVDSTGEITVVTERALPKAGERLRVRGVVREAFSIGDRTTVVIVESDGK